MDVWVVYTDETESYVYDFWEDFKTEYPFLNYRCAFFNMSVMNTPSDIPRVILVFLGSTECLSEDINKRLYDLECLWVMRGTHFRSIEPSKNWNIPNCYSKMTLASFFPLQLWQPNWKSELKLLLDV